MEEIDIKEFFKYLKRNILAFIIVIPVFLIGVLIYDLGFKQPVFQSKTTIVIAKSSSDNNSTAALNDINASQKLTSTYSEIATSELILKKV